MICITFYVLVCISNIIISVESIEVQTTLGVVKGKLVDDGLTGAYYYSFEGIPYAEAPVGNLRFRPPIRKRTWHHVFDATKPGCVCPQIELYHSRKEMDEDCLNFNIYTPANGLNKLLPVIFNIHGGLFNFLSGNAKPIYGPQLLIRNDLVVVTMNYRLGALGFLSFCNKDISGNAGIKDVVLLLEIIHENIHKFGGNPNKITVMGNGAGAAMAEMLMFTKQCVGLFQNVVLHGGSILSAKYIQLNPRDNGMLLAQELGIDLSNDNYIIEKLKQVNAFEIVEAQEAMSRRDPQRGFSNHRQFKPTVEIECVNSIITRSPIEMFREGALLDIPIFIGFNNQQGVEILRLLREEPKLIDRLNRNTDLLIPADIKYPLGSVERRYMTAQIRDFYFNRENISLTNVQNYINFISDSQYTFSIDLWVKLFKAKKSAPVYYYIFSADTELNWLKVFANINYPGAAHVDDIGYIFITSATKSAYQCLDPVTKRIQDSLLLNVKYFAYYGAPTPNPNTNYWPEAGKDRHHIIQNYGSIAVFHRPLSERIDFWTYLYEEYLNSRWRTSTYFCTNDDARSAVPL